MPLLKPPPFRQANRLGQNKWHFGRLWRAKRVVKPRETAPGGADGHKTVTTGPPHGPGGFPQLAPERKGAQLMPVQSAHCAPGKSQ